MKQSGWRRLAKRSVDVAVSGAALAVACPIIAVTAAAVGLTMGRPVFFRQTRPGYRHQTFDIWKLRTMRDAVDANGVALPDAERLTPLGTFLRRASLDELPQLWNVLRGEMSLVGPRPLLVEYLDIYSAEQARRHDVIPGITGWAQVHGRNATEWSSRLALDVWYVDNWSLALDAKIIALTVARLVQRKGVEHPGHATMPKLTKELANAVASGGESDRSARG